MRKQQRPLKCKPFWFTLWKQRVPKYALFVMKTQFKLAKYQCRLLHSLSIHLILLHVLVNIRRCRSIRVRLSMPTFSIFASFNIQTVPSFKQAVFLFSLSFDCFACYILVPLLSFIDPLGSRRERCFFLCRTRYSIQI
jgi:hypothetical protein